MAEVVIDIIGKDNFSSTLGNFGSIITGIESAINLVGQAFDAAVGAITPFIQSASESELAVAKLEAVLKATGGAAGMTSQDLQNMANQLQGVTEYSDETILAGTTVMLTFRNIGEETMTRAIPAMLDMAEIFGSVDSAAMQLGKALNDPVNMMGALSRAGVTFSDAQKEAIKQMVEMGNLAGAQNIILSELEGQVGGTAEAVGKTFAGSLEIAKNKLDNLRELIGGPVIAALTDLLGYFNNTIFANIESSPFIVFLSTVNDYLGNGAPLLYSFGLTLAEMAKQGEIPLFFGDLGRALIDIQVALDNGTGFLGAFVTSMFSLAKSDGPLAGTAQLLGELGAILQNTFAAFNADGFLRGIDTFFAGLFDTMAAYIDDWVASGGPGKITDALLSWINGIGMDDSFQSQALQAIQNFVLAIADAVGGVNWGALFTALDMAIGRLINELPWSSWGDSFGDALGDAIARGFSGGIQTNMETNKSNVVMAIVNALSDWFLAAAGVDSWKAFGQFWVDFANYLEVTGANAIRDGLNGIEVAITDAVRNWFNNIELDVTGWVRDHIVNPIKQFLGIASPSTVFMEIGRNIITGLVDGMLSLVDWAVDAIKGLVSTIIAPFKPVLDFLGIDTSFLNTSGGTSTSGVPISGANYPGGWGGPVMTSGTGTTSLGATGTVVNQYFNGATINVGSWDKISYDCLNPNPFVAATSGQLSSSSSGGGTTVR